MPCSTFRHLWCWVLVGLLASSPSHAMSIKLAKPDWFKKMNGVSSWRISLEGEMDAKAPAQLADALKKVGSSSPEIYLNAHGHDPVVGVKMGRLIRQAGASTKIGQFEVNTSALFPTESDLKVSPGVCEDACAVAFLGGVYRYAGKDDVYRMRKNLNHPPSKILADYFKEMGVNSRLSESISRQATGVKTFRFYKLTQLDIVNNGRTKPTWSVGQMNGHPYVKGEQGSFSGRGKAILHCVDGQIVYQSFYQAGAERAKELLSGQWQHALLLEDKKFALPEAIDPRVSSDNFSVLFVLTPEQSRSLGSTTSIGHAMQLSVDAPTFVGYQIDLPRSEAHQVRTLVRDCYKKTKPALK